MWIRLWRRSCGAEVGLIGPGPRLKSAMVGVMDVMKLRAVRERVLASVAVLLLGLGVAQGQSRKEKEAANYDRAARATVLHAANVYVAADDGAQRISLVTPGHEVVVVERNGGWVRVFANTDAREEKGDEPEFGGEEQQVKPASGWIRNKGIVGPTTADGAGILFGTAASLEDAATRPNAPKDAAEQAHLLYKRVPDYFPDSPLAAEAAWRAADIRWQMDRRDASTLPSAKEQEAYLRPAIFDGEMKRVMKSYPGTKYAAMAAFDLLDNKLCGDWQGLPKCPEMESGLYERYAKEFPDGPRTAEALYDAAYRQGVLVTMYTVDENRKRAEAAVAKTAALAAELKARFAQTDYAARAQSLAFRVQQGITVYGNDRD